MSAMDAVWELRPDLVIMEAEPMRGRPAVLVQDPLSGDFDRVEWPESDLIALLRRPRRLEEIRAHFSVANTLKPELQDIAAYLVELGKRGWLRGGAFWPQRFRPSPSPGPLSLLAHLLFVQISLFKPEGFLRVTAGIVRMLINPLTATVLVLCGMAGLYLAIPRWDDYWRDSLGGFRVGLLPSFILALVLVKTLHEFAHAYSATMAGARVTSMGVAFFFFMPLPYTDVTDAWRLPWRRRFRVAVAGMAAEMAVAGVALLLWALSPPGEAAMALARLSSVAVASTLLTNLNPGPRFDGYYVLVCLLRTENLRPRSLAMLRRLVWGCLLGIALPDEEAGLPGRRRAAILLYAVYALFYRFSLGFGLVLMAYYMFPKALGLPLAAMELWIFFGHPVAAETLRLWRNIGNMRLTPFFIVALAGLAGLAWWVVGERPRRFSFPAVTRAAVEEAVRSQRSGEVLETEAARGRRVAAGEALAVLGSPADAPLLRRAEWALTEAEISEEQSWRGQGARRDSGRREAETVRRRSELEALRQRLSYMTVTSPTGGVLAAWDESLAPGVSLARGRLLGWVVDAPVDTLSCYPDMEDAARLAVGDVVRFFPDSGEAAVGGRIVRIDESRPEVLEDPQLAAALGAVASRGGYLLSRPYAKVTVKLDDGVDRIGQTGRVWARGKPESLLERAWNWLRGLAVRESAF